MKRALLTLTADELLAFVLEVRAEADARLAVLNAVDPETLPPERRDEYQYARRGWSELRRMIVVARSCGEGTQ
jgi:hypothetical protein